MKKNRNKITKTTGFFSLMGLLFLSAILLPAKELKPTPKKEPQSIQSRGTEIYISNVKYSLNYLGLNLCDPVEGQDDNTLVYRLGYNEISDKILLPLQQVLSHNNLQVGKLTPFPGNQGFSYRVLYKHKHVGNLVVINERAVNGSQEKDNLLKSQAIINKNTIAKAIDPKPVAKLPKGGKPKMAIIIDDFGYTNSSNVEKFLALDLDITISIIPGHQFSTDIANTANKNGKEVIIHMPMASDKEHLNNGEKEYLLSDKLSEQEIRLRVEKAVRNIPHAKGMNNHMGSVASASPDVVLPLLKIVRLKNLYFVDSLTSPLSIIFENCFIQDVPTGRRRIFLDNEKNKDEIINQLRKAIAIAKRDGEIIVTGHTYSETLGAIQYMLANNEFADLTVCRASGIVR